MPKISLAVPHSLSQEDAAARLKGLLARLKEKHGDKIKNLTEEWGENTGKFGFSAMGFSVKAAAVVEPNQVKLDGEIPFAAMMFKGKIESEIRETLTRVLNSPARDA